MKKIKYIIFLFVLSTSTCLFAKEPDGFKLSEIKTGGLYDKLGLKNDDILLKLDGNKIKDIKVLRETFNKLKRKGDSLKLEIYRKGKIETLKYEFKQST